MKLTMTKAMEKKKTMIQTSPSGGMRMVFPAMEGKRLRDEQKSLAKRRGLLPWILYVGIYLGRKELYDLCVSSLHQKAP